MNVIVKYRWIIIAVVVSLCFYGSKFISTALTPNNDVEIWFDENDPTLLAYFDFQKEFGNDRILRIVFKEEGGIIKTECLQKIKRLHQELEKIEDVNHVLSIVNAKDFRRIPKGNVKTIQFTKWFDDDFELIKPEIQDEILSSSLIANKLINEKGDITILIIYLESVEEVHDRMDLIIPKIKSASSKILGEENYHLLGLDMITYGLNELSRKDFIKFTGISYLIMFIIIAFFYKRTAYVILSFLVAFTAIWLTFSVYGFLGFGLNIFTVMTPPLIIILSIMMTMHILNEFEILNSDEFVDGGKEKTIKSLKEIVKPCLYATLTTMIGFLSLISSYTAVLKEFGWLTALGCFLAFILAFLWSALFLPYIKVKRNRNTNTHNLGHAVSKFSSHIFKNIQTYTIISLLILIVSAMGINKIKIDLSPIGYFPASHSVVEDHNFMQSNWGDYYPIDIVMQTNKNLHIDEPVIINSMIDFDAELVKQGLARNTFSYIHVMDRFANVIFKRKLNEIIQNPILAPRFAMQFNKLVEKESEMLVSEDLDKARITITGSLLSMRELERDIAKMDTISKSIFGDNAKTYVTGYPALFMKIMNNAFDSMKLSLILAFILVFIAMLVLLQNFKNTCIAIIVNVFPIIVMLGFLGYCNINLDLATCTVSAIILGIAIDDTIHILYRYQLEKKKGVTVEEALKITHYHIGRVVVLTSIVLFAGFSILLLASLKTVLYFGLLSMVAVIAVLYGDIILLALLLKKLK